jgi:dihydropteroate synthase
MDKNLDKITSFSRKKVFEFNGKRMNFTIPRVMGVLNVTPDSFYDGGWYNDLKIGGLGDLGIWRGRVEEMIVEGAYIIDIGAVSTKPGAVELTAEEEKRRLYPVIKEVRKSFPDIIISIDTFRAEIAKMAAGEGADMINDISGGTFDPDMLSTIVHLQVPYIIMHIQGTPATMQINPVYSDVVKEVKDFLVRQAEKLEKGGHRKIILDPGFGFGKTVEHNYKLLSNLDAFVGTGYAVLAGLSRKSLINKVLNTNPAEALNGTTVLNTMALMKGAGILRVHDVKEAVQAVKLFDTFAKP